MWSALVAHLTHDLIYAALKFRVVERLGVVELIVNASAENEA